MTFGPALAVLLAVVAEPPAEHAAQAETASGPGSAEAAPAEAAPAEAAPAEAAPAGAAPADAPPAEPSPGDAAGEPTGRAGDAPVAPPLPAAPAGQPLADGAPLLIDRVELPGARAVERLVEPSGDVVEHLVNRAGTVQSCRRIGSLYTAPVEAQQPAAGGEFVEVVRVPSGALLRLVVAANGEPRAVALLAAPPPSR